jgi:hypothetical protein
MRKRGFLAVCTERGRGDRTTNVLCPLRRHTDRFRCVSFGHILGTNENDDCIPLILKSFNWRPEDLNPHNLPARGLLVLFSALAQAGRMSESR